MFVPLFSPLLSPYVVFYKIIHWLIKDSFILRGGMPMICQRNILVTGGAGFIGSHLVDHLLERGDSITVVDNFDPFYDIRIKQRNISQHLGNPDLRLLRIDIRNLDELPNNHSGRSFDVIVHLAARAGVRPSIKDPVTCSEVNINGTLNLLELAREKGVKQFVFASSSSVYGINPDVPWKEENNILMPISPYASTKISGELLGHVYSHLYGIRFLALRLFTVYGPRQRPDLAIHKFARLIQEGKPIPVYGDGQTRRDYTFVSDIVKGLIAAMDYRDSDYEVINMGNNHTVSLAESKGATSRRCFTDLGRCFKVGKTIGVQTVHSS